MKDKVVIRKYEASDCAEIIKLFYNTVHRVNARDYTEEQLNVWATGKEDCAKWDMSFKEHYSYVAVYKDDVVGFGDIDKTGYLDRGNGNSHGVMRYTGKLHGRRKNNPCVYYGNGLFQKARL